MSFRAINEGKTQCNVTSNGVFSSQEAHSIGGDDHTPFLGEHDKPYHSAYGGGVGGSTVCLWSSVDPGFFFVSSSNLSHHPSL
ncbi:hypothetical protein C4D60_Mb02t21030 [Musa balbisiana]|uniref:Uncharacterized protein n=1 Tax=Musa balbisiana TaxID=52838 RepID=A0A4V4H2U9_MUSBA|nr:hypothetical protein C4D60_Mb02t21030 [Musa balbisiana]